ncbi:MAG TPA: PQQ-binding-like beta-propeller repeat protein [Candidatus Eisenbacteria bacterium]|nr:PQQ-binding-like beta-propeller repeat protein [Candidatus Eisenbacteria bacterium]
MLFHGRPLRLAQAGFVLVALSLAPVLAAADGPPWSYQSPSKIVYFEVTPLGSLQVTSESGMVVLDPVSGRELWSRPGVTRFDAIENTPFAIIRLKDAAEVVQVETGKTMWTFASAGVGWNAGFVPFPSCSLVMIVDYPGKAPVLVGVDLATGAVRWKQTDAVDAALAAKKSFALSPFYLPLQDTDSTIVFYPSHGGPVRVHLGSGQVVWKAQGWGERQGSEVGFMALPSPIVRDGNSLFVPYGKRLLALDAGDGHILWDHAQNFPSQVVQMAPCAQGLMMRGRGKTTLSMLDRATGKEVWSVPFKTLAPWTPFVIRGERAYAAGEETLGEIALSTGATRILGKFEFKGKEVPAVVEPLESGVLVASSQNMWMVDSTGTQRYHCYLKAPGASFLAKFASTALMVGLNVVSVSATPSGGWAPVFTSNPILSMRFRATANARRYAYIFTSASDATGKDGFSLVRLDKDTGQEAGRLWIDDRSPEYRLDAISGTVYLLRDNKEIAALRY